MRHFTALATTVFCLGLLQAQDKTAAPEDQNAPLIPGMPNMLISAVIHVNTLDGDSFNRLVHLLKVFGAQTEADDHLRTIVVYGKPEVVAQIRRVVKQLDQPGSEAALGHNVEMTLTFLRCSIKAPAVSPQPLPPDIEAVAKQLRTVTQYKDIQLWEVLPLHLQEGKDTSETLQLPGTVDKNTGPQGYTPPALSVRIHPDSVYRKEETRYVRFRTMNISIKIPSYLGTQWNFTNVSLDTAGDFAEGQKTVVGKLSGTDEESAVFVVVALKVLD
jgi:hypothetical protein